MERIKQVEDIISLGEKKDHVEYLHNASWPAFYQLSTMREGLLIGMNLTEMPVVCISVMDTGRW